MVDLPKRVLVIGSGGAGKTVLANELGALLGLPVIHLDPLLYDEHWALTPPADFRARQRTVIGGDSWIIDGTYRGTLAMRLTAADTVIHFDPWWNPAVEDQASDRAHRIGQKKVVTVYRLVAAGTIEEKILQLKQRKKDLVNSVLSEDQTGEKLLSREDLDDLFRTD